jgi:hypothetical protein
MAEHQWSPPEHQDVTLHQPVGFDPELAGVLTPVYPPKPVWADIAFEQIPSTLHLKCFAVASSDVAVLVQTAWQGRLHHGRHTQDTQAPVSAVPRSAVPRASGAVRRESRR